MKRFSNSAVAVQNGSVMLFSAFEDGGEMWTGEGQREHRQNVAFEQVYRDAPIIHIGLSMWDIGGGENQRVDISAEAIGRSSFTMVFRTWGDTRVARVRADWLAIGPVAFDEDWEV